MTQVGPRHFRLHSSILLKEGATNTELLSSLDYFTETLKSGNMPTQIDPELIGAFIGVVSEKSKKMEIRMSSLYVLLRLLRIKKKPTEECSSLIHTLIDKGVLSLFASGVAEDNSAMRVTCIEGIRMVTKGCEGICRKEIVESGVIEAIAVRLVALSPRFSQAASNTAMDCCRDMIDSEDHKQTAVHSIISTIASEMRSGDEIVHKHAFRTMFKLKFSIGDLDEVIPLILDALINGKDEMMVIAGAQLINNLFETASIDEKERDLAWDKICTRPALMDAINHAFDCDLPSTRRNVTWTVTHIAYLGWNDKPKWIDVILESKPMIDRMTQLLVGKRDENNWVWEIVALCFISLDCHPRPLLQSALLDSGILVSFLEKADDGSLITDRWSPSVREILARMMKNRPDLLKQLEEAGLAHLIPMNKITK